MKVVYIAHPIAGDLTDNLNRIIEIVKQINLTKPDIVPLAPYFVDCIALDDENPAHRNRGIKNGEELLRRRFVDELWLYGDRISPGMWSEIKLCRDLGIRVVPQTINTHWIYFKNIELSRVMGNIKKTAESFKSILKN